LEIQWTGALTDLLLSSRKILLSQSRSVSPRGFP
jgi:hypothetical protein